ncbi:MAG: RnfABCDGE type electron transport complex subunit D [Firmicutes bacterium]|nr:RnfABCDGE type electron transport complex subunit D [Bacillota bacterium]
MQLGALFSKQAMMRRVLISLIPIVLFAVYSFGLRVLVVMAVVTAAGVLTEYSILRFMKGGTNFKIPEAIFVSCVLFTLVLPATVPLWVAAVGIAFGILFGKGVFGGFGRNVFNPALVGRCFVFISFPAAMTMNWVAPFQGLPGGFVRYSAAIDGVTVATPLRDSAIELSRLFLGQIAGSSGEISAVLILLAGVYLVVTKTASLRIMLSGTVAFFALAVLLSSLGLLPVTPLAALLSGGFLFAIVFMATDPITAPRDKVAQIFFGVLVGLFALSIRTFSNFPEGAMFAVLLGNTFGPLIEMHVKQFAERRRMAHEEG